ncbi:MFS transporter [Roseicyclus sp. F158]|uniref:MFS transporter n=1 Tax=Tropicimonas omnivorans TaxID=3075590 RepID=A0ABU3DDS1_9RHOB|nr:MFS transporter [Roseicyclus sp. F158]MDT0681297.1 MFS transporter [Roseicyclus sp. F158]
MSYSNTPTETNHLLFRLRVPVLLMGVMMVGANSFVLSPILSNVAAGLAAEPAQVAWAISAFGGATALSALGFATAIDRWPAGHVLGSGALLLAVAQALSGMSAGWVWLCAAQTVAGLATGVLLPGAYATTAATAPEGRAPARLGVVMTGWAVSLVLAVPLAAFVAEHSGWRMVYALLSGASLLTAVGLFVTLPRIVKAASIRTGPIQAAKLPGVATLLVIMFAYMTAFYGSFAFYGEGLRNAFGMDAQGAGLFVLAYGIGFGAAGMGLGFVAPRISRGYMLAIFLCLVVSYAGWRFALTSSVLAFLAAIVWGGLNQLGLNALVVSLNRQAQAARGAVMGLNSAVTYSAVFAGPAIMAPLYTALGFAGVTLVSAMCVSAGAVLAWRSF